MISGKRAILAGVAAAVVIVTQGPAGVWAGGNPWVAGGTMLHPRQAATATRLLDGRVLVVGSFPDPSAGAELYDPTTDGWFAAGPMVVARSLATATLLSSGKVLIAGGIVADTGHSTTRVEIYDPATNSFTAAAQLNVARNLHTATRLTNGQVLVSGGQNASGYIATAELYDPVNDRWTMAARMDAGYVGATATLLSTGEVLVAGGETFGDGRAELYDPATNSWTNAGTVGRIAETSTLLRDTRVLITGPAKEAHLYDPSTNQWSDVAPMLQDRVHPSATLLADGRVLVAGGTTTTNGEQLWLSSAEVYDPATNQWLPAGCMNQARWEQTATLLAGSNRVLVAGGDVPPMVLSSTELFDPAGAPTGPIDSCPMVPAGGSNQLTPAPTTLVTVAPSASSAVAPASSGLTGKPISLTLPVLGALTVSQSIVIWIIAGFALLLGAVSLYLLARRRPRGI